ncbi:MAG TPA: hypothetical protein VFO37_08520, partial [Chitinophagaceae bacterium]|nr:hypothetical protein [Chitinophagaceae bacterium]
MRAALAPLSSFLASHPDSYRDTFCSLFSNYFTQSHIGCKATNIIPAWGLIFFAGADLLENKVAQRTLRTTKDTTFESGKHALIKGQSFTGQFIG